MNPRKPATSFISFAGAVLLWSCGGGSSVCDKAAQATANLTAAASGCPSLTTSGVYSKASCESAVGHCSSSDQQSLSSAFDCMGKISRCAPGQEIQFVGLLSCLPANLSQACTDALNAANRGDGG